MGGKEARNSGSAMIQLVSMNNNGIREAALNSYMQ